MILVVVATKDFDSVPMLKQALEFGAIQTSEIEEVCFPVDNKSAFSALMKKMFARFPQTEFPIRWKDLDRDGAEIKKGQYGEYNAKAAIHRDEDLIAYGLDKNAQFLFIDSTKEFGKMISKVESESQNPCIVFNERKTPEHQAKILYRL